jgi:hypothetical protein
LRKQIEEFKERELKKFNEMSDKEKALNAKPLVAYEVMKNDINTRLIPGFDKHTELEKDNFRRYN